VLPAPADELGRMRTAARLQHIDLAVLAGEAEGEPALALAAILALEGDAEVGVGQVIVDPARRLGDQLHRPDRGFLIEFADGGIERHLALVDATLWHLPGRAVLDGLFRIAGRPAAA